MEWRPIAISCLTVLSMPGPAGTAYSGSFECGTPTTEPPGYATLAAGTSFVEARLVFVAFPDDPTLTVPTWAEDARYTLQDFIGAMSRGQQQLSVTILRRPENAELAWVADYPAAHYAGPEGVGYGALNTEIM